jgi:hypothetical protein
MGNGNGLRCIGNGKDDGTFLVASDSAECVGLVATAMSASSGNSLETVMKCVGELVPDDDSNDGEGNGCVGELESLSFCQWLMAKDVIVSAGGGCRW